jgi:hypothetical protein
MRLVIAAALALALAACSPAKETPHPTNARPESLLSPAQRRTEHLSPRWLVGYWSAYQDCSRQGGTSLWPDGTYTMDDAFGTWLLSGEQLTVIQKRPPSQFVFLVNLGSGGRRSRIRIVGPNAIAVDWPDAAGGRFYRCDPLD